MTIDIARFQNKFQEYGLASIENDIERYSKQLGFSFVDSALVASLDSIFTLVEDITQLDPAYQSETANDLQDQISRKMFLARTLMIDSSNSDLKSAVQENLFNIENALSDSKRKEEFPTSENSPRVLIEGPLVDEVKPAKIVKDTKETVYNEAAVLIGRDFQGQERGIHMRDISEVFDLEGLWKGINSILLSFDIDNRDIRFILHYHPQETSFQDALSIDIEEVHGIDSERKEELGKNIIDAFVTYFQYNQGFGHAWREFIKQANLKEDYFAFAYQSKKLRKSA